MAKNLIFGDRRFWPLFWTQFLGALNDNFFKNALVMLITYKSVSLWNLAPAMLVPLAGGIFIFPFFIFSATGGQIADRYGKHTVIQIVKFLEIVIMVAGSIGIYFELYQTLFVVLFCMGAQSAFFGPLKYGIIPFLVEEDELVAANAAVSAGTFIAILMGTIVGGSFIELPFFDTLLTTGLIGMAIIGFIASLKVEKVPPVDPSIKVDYSFLKPTWEILKMTKKNRDVFLTIMGISWFWFLGAAILSILPPLVKDVFGGKPEVATTFLAVFTIGMGIGSFLTERISRHQIEIGVVPISALFMSLFLFDLVWVSSHWPVFIDSQLLGLADYFKMDNSVRALFDLFMMSIFGGGYIVPQMSYVQWKSPREELSRMIAGNNIINSLFMVLAAVAVMVLVKFGIPTVIFVLSISNFIVSFILYALHSEQSLRIWAFLLTHIFYKVEVRGEENIPKTGSFIVACNHVSFVDWLLLMGILKRPIRFVIDWNYYYVPMGPFWFKQAKLVPIATKKESVEILEKAFDNIHNHINEGAILGIFPEGWITRNGQMRKFQPGIHKILKRDPVPVVMVGIDGLWGSIFSYEGGRVLFKFPKSLRKHVIIQISKPIAPQEYDSKKAEDIVRGFVSHYTEAHEQIESEEGAT
ncbi:MAG: glycerol acyltransferase [Bdellovibrio sp. CG12_big_fil_rev_8_21_14_0_65_39_13]|nr:MAG: glycerol acyltransferase [Bdellovibrio sp. CG22_combo_CG10-13_8_21_14_all_39_27]PIQ57571.1 MAG: glycerol acyltransferase [Bdellovibrio sp. CG12_big_fil_rev_8_21_14_0_65_39_13]PIR33774.1 MAG: glycerol acyltransferase [Bdellovibrio sp. CG11_big_fil_rev_8_21_14_0_20_39_38]